MKNRRNVIIAGVGCFLLLLVALAVFIVASFIPFTLITDNEGSIVEETVVAATVPAEVSETQVAIPTLNGGVDSVDVEGQGQGGLSLDISLNDLYSEVNPGVVNIQVFINEGLGGQGAGSGFILDDDGHIVTNNHVVAGADAATVIFYNGFEAPAQIIGLDDDSDLAVLQVETVPEGAHPLPLGDSNQIETGEWVVAIGNPFSLGGSITLGIVSAIGRSIPSGVTPFAIPEAIQTDAAINPGNSGGPLLNLNGQVIGVNAQIRTTSPSSIPANSGVGFAVPVNVVRLVVPVLIEQGQFQWSWIGVSQPVSVNLLLAQANNLDSQDGVYIHSVVPGGPADEAGLQGSTGSTTVNGISVPTGGDIIVGINGEPLRGIDELLSIIAYTNPGTQMTLQVLRNGEVQEIVISLAARPQNFDQLGQ